MVPSFVLFLQKSAFNLMLFAAVAISGGMLIWSFVGRVFTGRFPQIGTAEAVQLINRRDALVLDLRPADDYARGHIAGARSVPFADLAERAQAFEAFKARPLVVACQWGNQTPVACATLKKLGFTEIYALRGGVGAWQQAGLPLEKK